MKKILRSLGLTAALIGSVGLGTTPAHAGPGAVAFVGEAHINCFGCGVSSGTAELCAIGYVVPQGVVKCVDEGPLVDWANDAIANLPAIPPVPPLPTVAPNVWATYTVFESPTTCPITGSANGATTGDVVVQFNWTRVGATAVITTTGDINGGGVAVFAVTDPIGNPCGGPVTAVVAGAIAGT